MKRFRIAARADVEAIERHPYDELVPFRCALDVLERSAADYPLRSALTFLRASEPDFDPQRFTYRDLLAKVRQAANLFRSLGIGDDDTVAFLLPSTPEAYFTLFGAETAGRACPINFLLNPQHIAELIEAAGARVLVALAPHPDLDIGSKVAHIRERCPSLRHVISVGGSVGSGALSFDAELARQRSDALTFEHRPSRKRIAACFHTGGTTGTPKLAQHTHGNQIHSSWGAAQMYAMSEADVIVNGFPLFHVAGSFVYGLSALMSGAEIVLPTMLGMRNPALVRNYWKMVERFGVTLLAGVPTVIASLLATPVCGENLGSIRCMLTGGSPLPSELANNFEARFGVPVRNILGMTESAGVISIIPFHGPRIPGSCGLPLPFTEAKAVPPGTDDVDAAAALAAGETGVLVVRGPNVSPGYTDPRRDAGTFASGGWLVSGDLGHIAANGELHVTGRAKDIIIRGAHNIDPGEIEEALMRHEAVQVAAAVGEPDEYAGELPIAFVVLKPGASASEDELLAFVRPYITERPAWPKRITVLEAIPMTAVGKIYKPQLRLRAIERVVCERVAERFAAGRRPAVAGRDLGSRLVVRFSFPHDVEPEVAHDEVRAMMGSFAIDYDVVFESA